LDFVSSGLPANLAELVSRNVEIKARVVEQDERETGTARMALNFGHTVGHAIEQATGYGTYKHGEAVAVGIRAALHLSQRKFGLTLKEIERVEQALAANQLPLQATGVSRDALWEAMRRDKKVRGSAITWVLCPRLGEVATSTDVSQADVDEVLNLVLK
jgi:3-dehydroquinate synthase